MSAQRYLVTARKYRPQLFSELVAQEHVSETLKNAIRLDRLAHAYLFSGPRGVGKTTAARILAKAINCTTPLEERDGNAEPCRQCDSCKTFEQGRSLNIIEIDAASNNKVDDIRDLRETVRIPPQGGRKKVYIVDEVHMLSTAAFNALLKTLEEPPPHVLFIFATTEPHKVLPTILSRCQRFDFRRIAVPEIIARLAEICKEEQITADDASMMLIARKGDGALRDALSVFDQAVSLCGTDLKYADLAQALGVVDIDLYFEATDHVIEQNLAGMLRLVERTVRAGHDLLEFLAGLSEHLRNLLVARTMEDTALIEAMEGTRQRYAESAGRFTETDLLRLLTLAADAEEAVKESTHPRLKVETALLKMATIALSADLRLAIQKIERLEELARSGQLPVDGGAGSDGGVPETDRGGKGSGGGSSGPADPRQTSSASEASAAPSPTSGKAPAVAVAEDASHKSAEEPSAHPVSAYSTDRDSHMKPAGKWEKQAETTEEARFPRATGLPSPETAAVLGAPALQRRQSASSQQAVDVVESTAVVAEEPNAGPIERVWDDLLERVKNDKIQVWSLLHHTRPEGYREGVARIGVPNDFHRRVLAGQESYVLRHLRPLTDATIRSLQFVIREEIEAREAGETASDFDPYEYMQRKRQENPVIRALFDQFGGELVW